MNLIAGAVRGAVMFLFGEDLVKWSLTLGAAVIVALWIGGIGITNAILGQPFGAYVFGTTGNSNSQQSVAAPQGRPVGDVRLDAPADDAPHAAPLEAPVPQIVSSRVVRMIENAMAWVGVRYLWGGCTRAGVDCSCFVQNVARSVGITDIPRVTYTQLAWVTRISADEARAGDLVFFDNTCSDCGPNPTHVGLVLAPGRMIDAGDPVRVEAIYGGHNARYGRMPGL